jgi:chain length determinant protein (polysaccharide antigen chain regulator)
MNIDNIYTSIRDNIKPISIVILINIIIAVVYALNAPEVYTAKAYVLPPENKYIQALNLSASEVGNTKREYTVREVYPLVINNLQSRKYQRKFFFDNNINKLFLNDDIEESFEKNFHEQIGLKLQSKVSQIRMRSQDFLTVSFKSNESVKAATIINDYIDMVLADTAGELARSVNTTITKRINAYEADIDAKRNLAKTIKLDNIARLNEALSIAKELNINEVKMMSSDITTIVNLEDDSTTDNSKLYLYGTKALKAEIISLESRLSEDPFTIGLRSLEQKIETLKNIKIDENNIKPATIDQRAIPPSMRSEPKRKLIVILGTAFGILLAFLYLITKLFIFRKT